MTEGKDFRIHLRPALAEALEYLARQARGLRCESRYDGSAWYVTELVENAIVERIEEITGHKLADFLVIQSREKQHAKSVFLVPRPCRNPAEPESERSANRRSSHPARLAGVPSPGA